MQLSLDLLATLRVGLFAGVFGTLFVAIHLVWIALRGPLDPGEAELLLLCGAGQAAAAMHALSFPAGGTGALPCVAVVLALALDAPARGRLRAPLRLLAVATLLIATLAAASLRALLPFHFVEWRQPPIVKATERSALPELAGLRLSADTVRLVDDVTRLVVAATRSGEPLFTYPVFPIFNWLADRPVPTFAILHWIDVTPDPVVDADLARLLAAPPPVVVFQWVRDRLLRLNERYFRDGRQSAMARMQMALAALLADGYVLAYDGEIPYYYSAPPLQVWIRRDRAEAAGIEPLEREEEERDPGRE